jgi:hypothetical protein
MTMAILQMNETNEADYISLVEKVPTNLLSHSINYRNFLREITNCAEERYLLAYENDRLIAALPAFVKKGPYGPVVNSLPFYGSCGSIIALPECSVGSKRALLKAFDEMCRNEQAVCSTIISNPMKNEESLFEEYQADLFDERVGQLKRLPSTSCAEKIANELMDSLHQKTRNIVRKAGKLGFEIRHDGSQETLRLLHNIHKANIQAIGGLPKPWSVYESIRRNFVYDQDYRVYYARSMDGVIVSALLIFYFNGIAEYFTPATIEEYRSQQQLSYLIYVAMQDAALLKNCTWWNWGGTWKSQEGLYRFKARWGSEDFPYRYYIKEYNEFGTLRNCRAYEILEGYQYFYTLPFSVLENEK